MKKSWSFLSGFALVLLVGVSSSAFAEFGGSIGGGQKGTCKMHELDTSAITTLPMNSDLELTVISGPDAVGLGQMSCVSTAVVKNGHATISAYGVVGSGINKSKKMGRVFEVSTVIHKKTIKGKILVGEVYDATQKKSALKVVLP